MPVRRCQTPARRLRPAGKRNALARRTRLRRPRPDGAGNSRRADCEKTCMTTELSLVKLVFCGPSDVEKEIVIGKEVVEHWNQRHGEARGLWVKHHHWQTDTYPDLSDRAQNIPNRQLIDKSKILVAVFSRDLERPPELQILAHRKKYFAQQILAGKSWCIFPT